MMLPALMPINGTMIQVCREVRNFFLSGSSEMGDYFIESGAITLNGTYKTGQWLLITGSLLNDGIYKITSAEDQSYALDGDLIDQEFHGTIYGLRIPSDFIKLCEEIREFNEKTGKPSSLVGESVVGFYSHTRATDKNGAPVGWQTVFASRLAPFRRLFAEVKV